MAMLRWEDQVRVYKVEVPDLDAYSRVILEHLL